MKSTIRLSVLLILVFITYSCFSTKKQAANDFVVFPLSDTVTHAGGSLVYALPRTVINVSVVMERTIEEPGPYARYAGDMLGLSNAIQNESESWSIRDVTVRTHDELDPSEFYIIKSNNIFLSNVFALKKEGLILDINPEIFYNTDISTGTKETEMDLEGSFDLGSDEYFQVQKDTAYKRLKVDSLFIRIPYIVEKKKKLSGDQLAERAASKLMELREGKHLILTGEATVFPQSDAAIKEINLMEKQYTELFTGKTWKETKTFSYQVIPEKEMIGKPVVLFRFSELTGPVTGAAKGGTAVAIEFIPEQKTRDLTIINDQGPEPVTSKYNKLFYRVPDVVKIKISTGPDLLVNARRLIYQFGEITQIPSNYIIGK